MTGAGPGPVLRENPGFVYHKPGSFPLVTVENDRGTLRLSVGGRVNAARVCVKRLPDDLDLD